MTVFYTKYPPPPPPPPTKKDINRDSKMRVLAQTTTFTTFVARQRNR